jgi:hypothetical protein
MLEEAQTMTRARMQCMSGLVRICSMSAVLVLGACEVSAEKADSNLDCAAMISAANQLSLNGQLKSDPEFDSQALASSMMYLNAHAIPNGLREAEAFKQVNARRAELVDTTSPSTILDRAKTCISKTPGQ